MKEGVREKALPVPVLLMVRSLDLGGSERQMTEVAKGLDRTRFAPHVGCFHDEGLRGRELRAAGVPILKLAVRSFASPSALRGAWELGRYIRRHKIRLVHTFDVPLNIFAVPVARLGGAVVLSSQRAHRDLTPGIYRRLLRVTDRLADGVVVNCDHMRQHLIQDEQVDAGRIHLCYNGIDTEQFQPRAAARVPELADAAAVIGVVCALRPEKGLSTLIDAFAGLDPERARLKLVIVGDGPCSDELKAHAQRLGIAAECLFQPGTNDVANWLRQFDIFVLPSHSEAFSNSLMEAMACGCAVVASQVGGNPELVGRSERGLLFPAGNAAALTAALSRLLADSELRTALAGAGARFMRDHFAMAESVTCMQRLYDDVLS